ncbi:MAG: DUF1573 domain-containing protein [Bacteroidia bacterium]|nr:DUF1573 domain-containing protein [Bacteroidia bacterium]
MNSIVPAFAHAVEALTWNETTHDFGQIKKGTPVSHEFTFTNNGNSPLVISSVKASCGCTVADYSKEPVQPGEKGFVKATFNAANPGVFTKTITVNANTDDGAVVLNIKGEVVE